MPPSEMWDIRRRMNWNTDRLGTVDRVPLYKEEKDEHVNIFLRMERGYILCRLRRKWSSWHPARDVKRVLLTFIFCVYFMHMQRDSHLSFCSPWHRDKLYTNILTGMEKIRPRRESGVPHAHRSTIRSSMIRLRWRCGRVNSKTKVEGLRQV